MKQCNACFETKPYEDFHKKKRSKDGYKHQCKSCTNRANSEAYFADVESRRQKQREAQRLYQAKKLNLSEEDLDRMYDEQDSRCAICRITEEEHGKYLALDHCHETGQVRGLLCMSCNTALGHFKDNIENLEMAIKYLKASDKEVLKELYRMIGKDWETAWNS